jgi:hypothetical protein
VSGQEPGLRERLSERLKWACGHFQDDPECAELTAAGLEEFFQADLDAKDARIAELEAEVNDKSEVGHAVADAWRDRAEQAAASVARVREVLDYFDGQITALESGNPAVGSAFRFTFTKIRAALDQVEEASGT